MVTQHATENMNSVYDDQLTCGGGCVILLIRALVLVLHGNVYTQNSFERFAIQIKLHEI